MKRLWAAVLAISLWACLPRPVPPPSPPPSPPPTPVPTPAPTPEPALTPLYVQGNQFYNARGHVVMRGSGGFCCGGSGNIGYDLGKALGWPWGTEAAIDQFHDGGSLCSVEKPCVLHFRTGPASDEAEGDAFGLYLRIGPNGQPAPMLAEGQRALWKNSYPKPQGLSRKLRGLPGGAKYDLERWDDRNVQGLSDRVRYANDRGFYVEAIVGLDGWTAHHCPEWDYLSPWQAANNLQGFDGCDLTTMSKPIPAGGYVERYTRKIVATLGRHRVLWMTSNEGFKAEYSEAYYRDLIRIIRDEEEQLASRLGRPVIRHPIGVNQQERGPLAQAELLADYAQRHQGQRWHASIPAGVNEYPESGVANPEHKPPSSAFADEQALAYNAGGFFLLWYGEWRLEEYKRGISFVGNLAHAK